MGTLALGPFLAAAVLLVLAGVPKVLTPDPLVRALRSVLPAAGAGDGTARALTGPTAVRAVAAFEVVVGLLAVVRPDRLTGLLVALTYGAFTAFVAVALSRGGVLASCGCFGKADTPPTRSHLLVTALLALSGLLVAADPPVAWSAAAVDGATVALVGFAALIALLAYLVIAVLPTLTPAAVRSAGTVPNRITSTDPWGRHR